MERSFESIEDFQADFEQTEHNRIMDRQKKSSGIIYSLPKGKLFWFTKEPAPLKVISNGETIWIVNSKTGDQQKEKWDKLDAQTKTALLFLRREGKFEKYFKSQMKAKSPDLIQLTPKEKWGIKKIWIYVDPKVFNGEIFFKKIVFFFPLDRETSLEFSNFRFNQHLLENHKIKSLDPNITPSFDFTP